MELSARTFDEQLNVVKEDGVALFVQFYADWCNHCKVVAPIWARLADVYKRDPRIVFARVNGDNNDRLMSRFKVEGYPNFLFFTKANVDGELYRGYRTFEVMLKWLQDRMGQPVCYSTKKNLYRNSIQKSILY